MSPSTQRPRTGLGASMKWAVGCYALLTAHSLFADQCLPLVSPALNVNGIVVGHTAGGMTPPACASDPGWGGVVGHQLAYFAAGGQPQGVLDGQPVVFLAAGKSGTNLKTLYVGLHVENDPNLVERDHLVLLFDINGNKSLDAGDFAIDYDLGGAASPTTEACSQAVGQARYFTYSGGAWSGAMPPPAAVVSQIAWDYDPVADPETGIWELEVAIDLPTLGVTLPANGSKIGFGTKLLEEFQFVSGTSSTVKWRFPASLTSSATNTFEPANTFDHFDAANFETFKIGSACGYDVVYASDPGISSTSAAAAGGESNKFALLKDSDFDGSGNTKSESKNHFNAQIKLVNSADPSDMSPLAVPDAGKVKFWIKPWNAGFLGEYEMAEPPVSFSHVGEVQSVDIAWPDTKAEYGNTPGSQPRSDLNASAHACLKTHIEGFPVNQDESNDFAYRNLTYVHTSVVKDTITLSRRRGGRDDKNIPPDNGPDTAEFLLRANWSNLPTGMIGVLPASSTNPGDTLKWAYKFTNAAAVGLTDLGNDLYSIMLARGETKKLAIRIHGGKMPAPPIQLHVGGKAGGTFGTPSSGEDPLKVPVKAGQIVSIIAHGTVNLMPDGKGALTNIDANGMPYREFSGKKMLLPPTIYQPWQNLGALLVSFDKFKTAFVNGTDKTFLVPGGATEMFLGVNDLLGAYNDNGGPGFDLYVLISDPLQNPTSLVSRGNAALGQPDMPRAGINLPALAVSAFQVAADPSDPHARDLRPASYVAWAVYFSHADADPPEDTTSTQGGGKCGCKGPLTKNASFLFPMLFTAAGLGLLRRRLRPKKA